MMSSLKNQNNLIKNRANFNKSDIPRELVMMRMKAIVKQLTEENSKTLQAGFELGKNLNSDSVEESFVVVTTNTPSATLKTISRDKRYIKKSSDIRTSAQFGLI